MAANLAITARPLEAMDPARCCGSRVAGVVNAIDWPYGQRRTAVCIRAFLQGAVRARQIRAAVNQCMKARHITGLKPDRVVADQAVDFRDVSATSCLPAIHDRDLQTGRFEKIG